MARSPYYRNTYRNDLLTKINSLPGQVFTREELSIDTSNKEQLRLNRALKAFLAEGILIKVSHGLYAKATQMRFSNGETRTVLQASFEEVAVEALDKLNIQWELSSAIQAYNRGETTQIPAVFSVSLRSRFRGSIRAEGRHLLFERKVNAR